MLLLAPASGGPCSASSHPSVTMAAQSRDGGEIKNFRVSPSALAWLIFPDLLRLAAATIYPECYFFFIPMLTSLHFCSLILCSCRSFLLPSLRSLLFPPSLLSFLISAKPFPSFRFLSLFSCSWFRQRNQLTLGQADTPVLH